MKTVIVAVALILSAAAASAQSYYGTGSNPRDHYVGEYTRKDGTYVSPHYQTNPNSTQRDNYGTIGNVNPHTGAIGTRRAYR